LSIASWAPTAVVVVVVEKFLIQISISIKNEKRKEIIDFSGW
jgi:hypothetical protein